VHKSDAGGVRLALENANAVHEAWRGIADSIARHLPGPPIDGCLVQPMVTGGVEMIVGARWDAQFGAVVMAGAGGIFVEIVKDAAFALAPLTPARARGLLEDLRVWPLLEGARGRPAADIPALVDALVRVSWLADTLGSRLAELDVNPLLVQTKGVVALDARATLAKTEG
jgi:acetyl-CoA synthetase (ADP-forming)